jgi:hypothetical protein
MRSNRRTRERRDWPYITIAGVPYRVRRVVADNVAWVTEVTSPMEKFAIVMVPADTPFIDAVRTVAVAKIEWGYHDANRTLAGPERGSVPDHL